MANMQSLKQTRDVVSKSSGCGAIRVHCPRSAVFLHVSVNSSAVLLQPPATTLFWVSSFSPLPLLLKSCIGALSAHLKDVQTFVVGQAFPVCQQQDGKHPPCALIKAPTLFLLLAVQMTIIIWTAPSYCTLAKQDNHGGGGHFHPCMNCDINQECFYWVVMRKPSKLSWQVVAKTPQKCWHSRGETRQIQGSGLLLLHSPSLLTPHLSSALMTAYWPLVNFKFYI